MITGSSVLPSLESWSRKHCSTTSLLYLWFDPPGSGLLHLPRFFVTASLPLAEYTLGRLRRVKDI